LEPYLFIGAVLPERTLVSFDYVVKFSHLTTNATGVATISIVLSKIAVWVESEYQWDIFDLRNLVKNLVQSQLNMLGFLKGYSYDIEITRVINRQREINYVYGIEIPCLEERGKSINLNDEMEKLRDRHHGPNGILVTRCLNDLSSAMKHADDTGFYCYRAIESLRHHCATVSGLTSADKKIQWMKFREVAECDEETLRFIKTAADPLRHGTVSAITSDERAELFMKTWDIVGSYLHK